MCATGQTIATVTKLSLKLAPKQQTLNPDFRHRERRCVPDLAPLDPAFLQTQWRLRFRVGNRCIKVVYARSN
jgi:hypothetical protein